MILFPFCFVYRKLREIKPNLAIICTFQVYISLLYTREYSNSKNILSECLKNTKNGKITSRPRTQVSPFLGSSAGLLGVQRPRVVYFRFYEENRQGFRKETFGLHGRLYSCFFSFTISISKKRTYRFALCSGRIIISLVVLCQFDFRYRKANLKMS